MVFLSNSFINALENNFKDDPETMKTIKNLVLRILIKRCKRF